MTSLKLADLILDPRRLIYVQSLKAVVCSGLLSTMERTTAPLKILHRAESAIDEYRPDFFIHLGGEHLELSSVSLAIKKWSKKTRMIFVESRSTYFRDIEQLGCEVHRELVWGNYRFATQESEILSDDSPFLTISGPYSYFLNVGTVYRTYRLPVFLKHQSTLLLPTIEFSSAKEKRSVCEEAGLGRCDIFAIGHHRVFPLGKVRDIKPVPARGLIKKVKDARLHLI